MDRADFAGLVAAVGIFLLAFGVAGSVTLDTPMLGEILGLSTRLSLQLAGAGVTLLLLVTVFGSLVKRGAEREE